MTINFCHFLYEGGFNGLNALQTIPCPLAVDPFSQDYLNRLWGAYQEALKNRKKLVILESELFNRITNHAPPTTRLESFWIPSTDLTHQFTQIQKRAFEQDMQCLQLAQAIAYVASTGLISPF